MDHLTPKMRSWNMGRIKGKDTKPEVLVRSMLHRAPQKLGAVPY
jgi:DNA mismatch endonuclease (patch repair protein)